MQITFEYDLLDNVKILPLERNGKVISIWITQHGTKYEVRYFDNAESKTVYFYPDELEKI